MSAPSRSILSPEDQSVTFVELFFDLVFVFAVTQTVALLVAADGSGGFTPLAILQTLLVFWLVWWAWTQFTWALNACDTTHPLVEFGALLATAVAFFMAVAVPDAFQGRALWFAVPYVLARTIGLYLYARAGAADEALSAPLRLFTLASLGGLLAVMMGAFLGGA